MVSATATMIEISPYFEPGAPPPTLPILISQTEIGNTHAPGKLVAQEEIGSGPTVARLPCPKRNTTPSHFPLRSSTPKSRSKPPNKTLKSVSLDVDSDSESSLSSLSSSSSDPEFDNDLLIPKPEGEAGRPGRGGYNLEKTLAWEAKDYRKMKVIPRVTCWMLLKTLFRNISRNLSRSTLIFPRISLFSLDLVFEILLIL